MNKMKNIGNGTQIEFTDEEKKPKMKWTDCLISEIVTLRD